MEVSVARVISGVNYWSVSSSSFSSLASIILSIWIFSHFNFSTHTTTTPPHYMITSQILIQLFLWQSREKRKNYQLIGIWQTEDWWFTNFAQGSFDPRIDSGFLDSSPEEHGSHPFALWKRYLLLHRANKRFIICYYKKDNEIINALLYCNTSILFVLVWQAFAYF